MFKINVQDLVKVLTIDDSGVCEDGSKRTWVKCSALSFFDEKYREALTYYGTKSGRDVNKDVECGFHPVEINNVTVYEEAKYTIICKKIYADDIKPELFLDESIDKCYPDHSYHKMYICEVTAH